MLYLVRACRLASYQGQMSLCALLSYSVFSIKAISDLGFGLTHCGHSESTVTLLECTTPCFSAGQTHRSEASSSRVKLEALTPQHFPMLLLGMIPSGAPQSHPRAGLVEATRISLSIRFSP